MRLSPTGARTVAKQVAGGLLVAGGVVAAAAWTLRRNGIRFVAYEALPWPHGPWLAVSLLAFGVALIFSIPAFWRTSLVVLGCAGVAAAVLWLIAASWIGAGRGTEVESYPAPDAAYRLVVHQGGFFDPIYYLSIEQQTGPLSRSWYLGCLDGDYDWIEEARWESPTLFSATTSGEDNPIRIRVDPASGQPLEPSVPTQCDYRP